MEKHYVKYLVIVLVFLFLFLGMSAWKNSQPEIQLSPGDEEYDLNYQIFNISTNIFSPFAAGVLVVIAITLLLIIVVSSHY